MLYGIEKRPNLGKMSYGEFFTSRDNYLRTLEKWGAHPGTGPTGWSEEINQGFTHDEVQKRMLTDYSGLWQEFLNKVFYPVLYNANRGEHDRLKALTQGSGGGSGTPDGYKPPYGWYALGGAAIIAAAIFAYKKFT
jgi:hypothetical protein